MDRDLFDRVQALFREVLLSEPDDPAGFLEARCGDDEDLREQVRALLAAHAEAGDFLEERSALAELLGDDGLVGRTVGVYRIVRRLGGGGMGEVFLAERSDDVFRKRLAIKVLPPGKSSDEIIRRFTTERQILAGLDHPNIAKVLDGGTTDDGVPYFAMEYVEGKPILDYCDDRWLDVDDRLRLFLTLCDAVQYAHGNLVVHRDLKSGNVLVTADGTLKLLDFGIAKLLNPELSMPESSTTVTGLRLLTPESASPEQLQGGPITVASDVYSLGVLLYRLLTGRSPYRPAETSAAEMLEAICRRVPEAPSMAVSRPPDGPEGTEPASGRPDEARRKARDRARLRRRLAGDLDAIVGKALRKVPEQRYGSVALLAEDVRHHLLGLPVRARGGSRGYRSAKFVRRHLWVLAASVLVAAALLGLGGRLAWEKSQAEAARAAAEMERDRSERLAEFLVALFAAPNPRTDAKHTVTATDMLRRGAEKLMTDLAEEPEVQARARTEVGRILGELGEYETASTLLEGAVATQRKLGDERRLADSLAVLASLRVGQGDLVQAEVLLREAETVLRHVTSGPDSDLADVLHELGLVSLRRGRLREAARLVERAIAMHREVGGNVVDEAQMLNTLAGVRYQQGELAEAETLHRQILALRLDALGPDHLTVSETRNNLGAILTRRGESAEALRLFEQALATRRAVLGETHPQVAIAWHNVGGALRDLDDLHGAESAFHRAISIFEQTVGRNHPYTAGSLLRLGTVLEAKGDLHGAESLYRDSVAIFQGTLGDDHAHTALARLHLAALLARGGSYREALDLAQRAQGPIAEARGAAHWQVAAAATVEAACRIGLGDLAAGRELLDAYGSILEEERDPSAAPFRDAERALVAAARRAG